MFYIKQLLNDSNEFYYNMLKDDILSNYKESIFIYYSKRSGINNDIIDVIKDSLINYSDYDVKYYYKNQLHNYIIDTLASYKRISLKDAIKIAAIIKKDDKSYNYMTCDILSVIYKKRFEMTLLRGCCQGDVAYMFYDVDDVNIDFKNYIEGVIFNTGYEIMIHDDESIPLCADDIQGYCEYIIYDYGSLKDSVARFLDTTPDNIVFYEIKNTYTVLKVEYEIN